jgi:hypothetical protein
MTVLALVLEKLLNMQIGSKLFYMVYENTASDYFNRMGGAGRYDRFADWHPLGMTILFGLRCMNAVDRNQLENCLIMLPSELRLGCDGLAKVVETEFAKRFSGLVEGETNALVEELLGFWGDLTAKSSGRYFEDFDKNLRILMVPR